MFTFHYVTDPSSIINSSLLSTCSSSAPYRHFCHSRTFCLCPSHFKNIMEKYISLLPILECANHLATSHQRPGGTFVCQLLLPSHFNTIIISAFICCCSCFQYFYFLCIMFTNQNLPHCVQQTISKYFMKDWTLLKSWEESGKRTDITKCHILGPDLTRHWEGCQAVVTYLRICNALVKVWWCQHRWMSYVIIVGK